MEKIEKLFNDIKKKKEERGRLVSQPLQNSDVDSFAQKFMTTFQIVAPPDFVKFLFFCDGLTFNGYTIYSSYDHVINGVEYGIFQNNDAWYTEPSNKQYIYFAEGDQDLWVYDKKNALYQLRDRYSFDVFETYESMEKMLEHILFKMLNT